MKRFRSVVTMLILICVLSAWVVGADSPSDLPKKAVEHSQITLPGSRPFVLKATVLEATNLSNENYKAEIEEYWLAPDKWRRSVKSPSFSQTLVVNGDKTIEEITGDYYPNWLRNIVAAIFNPGDPLRGVEMSRSSDNPMIGGTQVCRRFTLMAGIAPVSNKVFSSFCFQDGLLESVNMPGYTATYKNYKSFAGKQVARTIGEYIEPGTELEATISELKELDSQNEANFAISQTNIPLQTVVVDEGTLRSLGVSGQAIAWPTVRSGAVKGTLSLYVCLDRGGHVREVYELNSSNAGLSDVVRDQVMKWQFKPALSHGVPVQLESILTFAFETSLADPIPVLEEQDGAKLILRRVEPDWPQGLPVDIAINVTLGVNETGDYKGLVWIDFDDNRHKLDIRRRSLIAELIKQTLPQWKFQPYVRNGKVTEYQVKVKFEVK